MTERNGAWRGLMFVWGGVLFFGLSLVARADSTVVFNEIMYHPADDGAVEWIEFHNQMAVNMDLSGWSVQGGIDYTFPPQTVLPGGGYLVLAASPEQLEAATGLYDVLGPFTGKLSNSGESLKLLSHNHRLMDRLDYDDEGDWPVAPDGSGVTLAKFDPDLGSAHRSSWGFSRQVGGTPGGRNVSFQIGQVPGIQFNEIASCTDAPFQVEIHNSGDDSMAIDGFVLLCTGDRGGRYVFAEPSIGPGEYRVLDETALGFAPDCDSRLFLYDPSESLVIDAARVTDRARARETKGNWAYPDRPTFGGANSFAFHEAIVINEIMYHGYPQAEQAGGPATYRSIPLVSMNAAWRYNQSGVDLGPDWYTASHPFDQETWFAGPGLLARESGTLPEPIGTELAVSSGRITYYFETQFVLDRDLSDVDHLQLNAVVDDGAVFYLNGTRVHQINMPAGPLTAGTLALSTVSDATRSGWIDIEATALKEGVNLLSVEVHQASVSSSDIVFGLELAATELLTPPSPGQPYQESPEEWIELHNRSKEAMDLSGWRLADGIEYEFPPGMIIAGGDYLVVTSDVDAFAAQYPDAGAACVGDFSGRLSNQGERLMLLDSQGNQADQVQYYDDGYWSSRADGGGSTLELRDPGADNAQVSAWAASEEGGRGEWRAYEYTGVAQEDGVGPNLWNEFVMGLLSEGEVLLDDISVVEDPAGTRREVIQNGTFEIDAIGAQPVAWRLIGTHGSHGRSRVVPDPDRRDNRVLYLAATGPAKDTHDHAETTLIGGRRIQAGRTYRIAFKAKWLSGSNQLNTRLYFNWLQKTTLLQTPAHHGTPAARNSVFEGNIGPTFDSLSHYPVIPSRQRSASATATVSVFVQDNDGIDTVRLYYAADDGPFDSVSMMDQGDGLHQGTIPTHDPGTVVQFYVEATDAHPSQPQVSWYPPAGPESRALYVIQDGAAQLGDLHNLRIIMTEADEELLYRNTNLLSNDRLGATIVYDEKTVFYDVGVRLKGSGWGRTHDSERGYNLRFRPEQLFRGVHETIAIERGGSKRELVAKHMFNAAGGGLGNLYDDVAHVMTPRDIGVGLLSMARYTSLFLKSQYENGGDGTLYNYELLYTPTTTVNGHPEGLKLNYPYTHSSGSFDFADYGDDKEIYRWFEQIRNNRVKDDYRLLIALSKACSLTGAALERETQQVMDVSQWMRTFGMESLCGNDDFYGRAHDHNLRMYQRPWDNKMVALPWDLDRAFRLSTSDTLWPMRLNLRKVIELPAHKRLYYGHLRDMIGTTCNEEYMAYWTSHYSAMTGESFSSLLRYIRDRSNYVLTQLPANPKQFSITDTGFATHDAETVINGEAGIGIRDIVVEGEYPPLTLAWSRSGQGRNERFFWQARIPLVPGVNTLTFQAYDFHGNQIAADSITVTRTSN